MKPHFREDKTSQAAALLLFKRGGTMSYMKLIKLLYLVDRKALSTLGRPVTYDRYVSMDHGPVLSTTYDLIREEPPPGVYTSWHALISAPHGEYEVSLMDRDEVPPSDLLSRAEEAVIQEVFSSFGTMDRWELRAYVHKLPEWQDPEGTSIPIEELELLRGAGLEDDEASHIINELNELAIAERLLE